MLPWWRFCPSFPGMRKRSGSEHVSRNIERQAVLTMRGLGGVSTAAPEVGAAATDPCPGPVPAGYFMPFV